MNLTMYSKPDKGRLYRASQGPEIWDKRNGLGVVGKTGIEG